MRRKFSIGTRVKVCGGSGLVSEKCGTVIDRREIPMRGDGIPNLIGYYYWVDWNKEVAIRYDSGELRTMFKDRLIFL